MFNSRSEVDKHVENCLKRINNEKERNLRSFTFAKLYYKVGDYKQARRYVVMYLNLKPTSAEAQHLLGNCLEKLGQKEAALDAYKYSLNLDPKQISLVLKLCQLLAENDELDVDGDSGAQYYLERAQALDPTNAHALQLRQKLVARSSRDPKHVTEMLLKELESRPQDVDVRVRLLKHLANNNQLKDATQHILSLHSAHLPLLHVHHVYIATAADILLRYQRENELSNSGLVGTWQFWFALIGTLDTLAALSLDERYEGGGGGRGGRGNGGGDKGYVWNVWVYDQMLGEAVKAMDSCPEKQLSTLFLLHLRGQLCAHLVTLLFRHARLGLVHWREAVGAALPLLFAGYHLPPPDTTALWLEHTTVGLGGDGKGAGYSAKEVVKRWNVEASYRCAQLGYVLYALGKDRKTEMIERAKQGSTGLWREQLYKKLFVTRDYQNRMKSSFFTTTTDLLDIPLRLPDPRTLHHYATTAQLLYADSLHHLIWLYGNTTTASSTSATSNHNHNGGGSNNGAWLAIGNTGYALATQLADLSYPLASGTLPLSIKNLNNCAAETLNVLDIQAFVYCATICAKGGAAGANGRGFKFEEQGRPPLLPAAITEQLGTINQINWLKAAFRVQKGECYFGGGGDKNELRLTLIRGIEVIRCIGNHGIDVVVLVQLAKTFQERAKLLKSHSEIEFNEARAELYWKAAMPLLDRLKNKHTISYSTKRLFECQTKQMPDEDVQDAYEAGKLFYGVMYLKKKELERALAQFEHLKDPYSSYYRAQIYQIMADEQLNHRKETITSEMRSQSLILLTRARDCYYLTLDRLRDPAVDRDHPLNATLSEEIAKIERLLSRVHPDGGDGGMLGEGGGDGGEGHEGEEEEEEEEEDGERLGGSMVTARDGLSMLNASLHNTSFHTSALHQPHTPNTSQHLATPNRLFASMATRRDEARPSPERLDAQLRQLSLARDATTAQLLDQNRAVVDTHRALLDELKGLRESVNGLSATVGELKGIRPSFDELRAAVEDLQSLRNLPDMVHEMKREITELKSNKQQQQQQQQQISDEDLFNALEEEYGPDFANSMPGAATPAGLNSSMAAVALGGNLYQSLPHMAAAAAAAAGMGQPPQMHQMPQMSQMPQRPGMGYNPAAAAAAAAAAAGLYPGMYPGMYQPYAGLSITQGTLPFVNAADHHSAAAAAAAAASAAAATLGDFRNILSHPLPAHLLPHQHHLPTPQPPTFQPPAPQQQQQQALPYQQASQGAAAPSPILATAAQLQNMFKDTVGGGAATVGIGAGAGAGPIGFGGGAKAAGPIGGLNLFGGAGGAGAVSHVSGSGGSIGIGGGLANASTSSSISGFGGMTFSLSTTSTTATTHSSGKPAPVNVVITSSDPLPLPTTTQAPILSVIIPPQHLKANNMAAQGQKQQQQQQHVHNYQIPLPANATYMTPSVLNQATLPVSAQGLLSNVGPPKYSAVADRSADKSLENNSIEEHDAQPDFKPIIPLPDEVQVITGEEDEKVLFCERGKLHRFLEKDWKERGVGDIKLLQSKEGKVRILMRRDRVHKICANHYITGDMQFVQKSNMDTAYVWVANDFADETVTLEKFCIRFKTADIALEFAKHFEAAQSAAKLLENTSVQTPTKPIAHTTQTRLGQEVTPTKPTTNLGGFVFTSTPTFKPKDEVITTPVLAKPVESGKTSPFAGFSFNTTTPKVKAEIKPVETVEETDEFIPTAEFKPVVPLPELVDIKTGEEGCDVLFECHSKLLKFDATTKEWKERGIGQMKLLKDGKIVRFLMRREKVHKVCCNHQLTTSMDFSKMKSSSKVINWFANDYSEGILEPQMFALRFKNEEVANMFLDAIGKGKKYLESAVNVKEAKKANTSGEVEKKVKTAPIQPSKGFGDKFKPKSGSWSCKICYIHNEAKDNYCVACESPKNDSVPKKPQEPPTISFGTGFTFGMPKSSGDPAAVQKVDSPLTFGKAAGATSGFGNAFKPEQGSWECQECYVRNPSNSTSCSSCATSRIKPNIPPATQPAAIQPAVAAVANTSLNLPSGLTFTAAAAGPGTEPKTASMLGSAAQFTFGIPAAVPAGGEIAAGGFTFNTGNTTTSTTFPFLTTSTSTTTTHKPSTPLLTTPVSSSIITTPNPAAAQPNPNPNPPTTPGDFTFGSAIAHTFDFQPRHSPRRHSNSLTQNDSGGEAAGQDVVSAGAGGEESEASYAGEEEEETIYFKPVIPLPDEVQVVTGEEEEKVISEQRAKLYRFSDGQWKERGVGNIKVLMAQGTGKARVVMRRELIHKVCLNHYLTSDIKYSVKDDKTWLFSAADFSEGVVEVRQFCLRFRNSDFAVEFKSAVDDVLSRTCQESDKSLKDESKPQQSDSDDVILISETQVTDSERAEALRLKLPEKFMSYRQLPDCKCDQCKKDDLYYKETTNKVPDAPKPTSTLLELLQKPTSLPTGQNSFFFGTPKTSAIPVFGTTGDSQIKEPPRNLFGLFGQSTGFGSNSANTSNTGIFGSPASSNNSIFGSNTPVVKPGTIFGGGTTPTETPASIFGPNKSIFEASAAKPNIFETTTKTPATTNIFAAPKSLFTTTNTTTNAFNTTTITKAGTDVIGPPVATNNPESLFGIASSIKVSTNLFGGSATIGSIGSSSADVTRGNKPVGTGSVDAASMLMFETTDAMTFASLAAGSGDTSSAFKSDESFKFAGTGTPIFGAAPRPAQATPTDHAHSDDDDADTDASHNNTQYSNASADNYDPHYEPIVPLPNKIVVCTGEENEEVKFSERSKLYRYSADTKEWKERGVGDIKVLFNPSTGVYRLLLRREQVHKIVLNSRIVKDLNLLPMLKNEKSYMWVAHNFLEETGTVVQEKLAAQFKNIDIACKFYNRVQEAINHVEKLSEQSASAPVASPSAILPTTIPVITGIHSGSGVPQVVQYVEEESSDDGDEADDDYDDDKSMMCSKQCKLSEVLPEGAVAEISDGLLQVFYDDEYFGARYQFNDADGEVLSSTIIGVNTVMALDGNECRWRSVESAFNPPSYRELIATFENNEDAEECYFAYQEGLGYAHESNIQDVIPQSYQEIPEQYHHDM